LWASEAQGKECRQPQIKETLPMPQTLVLVRHGESEWNKLNLFTGWRDPDLTDKGRAEAKAAGQRLKALGMTFDIAYTSALSRAQKTLAMILAEIGQSNLTTIRDQALNERDYGELSGLNKDDARKKWGEQQVHIWRRSYDIPPPGGESLKDTAARVLPYFQAKIVPDLKAGKRVIVGAHGNSLRALIMHLEGLTGEEIIARELGTAIPIIYALDDKGKVLSRKDLTA
jgi:2,3-bisphosphoglycerate-dependent phosphoglycerate mutase